MMTAMPNSLGRFRAVLGAGWALLGLGAWIYARMKGIPEWTALPVAAAFLVEFPFYLLPGFEAPRAALAARGRMFLACILTASAIAPYLIYAVPTGAAGLIPFLALLLIAAAVSFWYLVLPAAFATDALFLLILAAVVLAKVFDRIYLSPIPKLSISVLGHIMLIRTAAMAILTIRGNTQAEFRFLPNRREWLTGLRYFAMLLPVAGIAYWALGLVRLRPAPLNAGQSIGTFFGIFWVVALSEEFFFRGLLQQWMERWTGSAVAALVVTSVLFGSAHLGFHGAFPSWRFAIVAAILGFFCGLAWKTSRSVQASMVTHALTVTLWRMFFR
jgi:membrane protease YdiL (CAAX protease family)